MGTINLKEKYFADNKNLKQITDEQIEMLISKGVTIFEHVKKIKESITETDSYTEIMGNDGRSILIFKDTVLVPTKQKMNYLV